VVIDSFRVQDGTWTLANYRKAIGDPFYWEVLLITFRLSLWVTIAAFLIGYPLAYFIVRMVDSRLLRSMLYIVVVTPLFTSNIVRAFGWIVLLGRRGLVNDAMIATGITERPIPLLYGESSIVIGLTYIMVPFMVLTIASVLQNIDRSLEEAARDLGAGAWSTFWRVTFPLSMPGVIAGALIVFTLSVSAYVTPSILSGGRQNTTSILIFQQYASILDFHFGGALAVVLLVTTIILVSVSLIGANRRQQVAS
jgi:putative spermidine/putrescine transport system permease protein